MKRMDTHVGGIGVFPGSFNPPHIAHIKTIRAALGCFDVLHMFVRYNEGVDLVDWDTKRGWFDRINEETGGRLVIHKMVNTAVTGKKYTMEDFFEFIRNTAASVGEPVSGFVFGNDYEKTIPLLKQEFPQMVFLKGPVCETGEGVPTSTAIRKDLEGHREWLPPYVYETLHRLKEEGGLLCKEPTPGEAGPDHKECQPETIDLTHCPVLGNGFNSTVYELDEKTVVKVYRKGRPPKKVQQEYTLSRAAFLSGIPCVDVTRVVQAGGAPGLVMEKLTSSLGLAIHQHPDRMEACVDQYVALAKKLHHTKAPADMVPPVKDSWLIWTMGLSRWCRPEEVSLVYDLVERMPEADTFLHGDLHPGNIMFRGEEPVLIDMTALARGSSLCDLAVIYRGLIMGPQSANVAQREKNMGMRAQEIRQVGDLFFMKYLGVGSREELEDCYARLHLLYALSVVVMCGKEYMKDAALAGTLMDKLLRGVVVPGKNVILEIWRDRELLPGIEKRGTEDERPC